MVQKIISGTLIHDRMWVLPHFLKELSKVKGLSEIVFLANNCKESTLELLANYGKVYIDNTEPSTADRQPGRGKSLAYYRNQLLDIVFGDLGADKMLSLDSDIISYPDIVYDLLSFRKDIISCYVWNDLHFKKPEDPIHIGNIMEKVGNTYGHIPSDRIRPNRLMRVDLTGAVAMIDKKVYNAGVRYSAARTGEDEGFCRDTEEKGFMLYCYTKLLLHCMTVSILNQCIATGEIDVLE